MPIRPAKKKRRWPIILGIVCGSFVLLLLVAYFVVTSAWFLKVVVLPRASEAVGATITVEDASLSPFSSITLSGLKVQSPGAEPLFQATTVLARYSLWDILGGHINIAEVTLTSPRVTLVQNPDGSSNLDPILKAGRGEPSSQPPQQSPSEPMQLTVTHLSLTQGSVRLTSKLADGSTQVAEITKLNFTADDLANSRSGKVTLSTEMKFDQGLPGPSNGVLLATLAGQFQLALDAKLMPSSVKGGLKLEVPEAHGAFRDAGGLALTLDTDVTPAEVRELAFRIFKSGQPLATLTATGPFNASKLEGTIKVELGGIDRQALNLAGAAFGGDFNATTLSSSNLVELAEGAKLIRVNGQIALNKLSLTRQNVTTPTLDFRTGYSLAVDQAQKSALLQALTLTARQNQAEILRGSLAKPMAIDWSGAGNPVDESAFDLSLTNLNLADWRAFASDFAPAGQFDLKLKVLAQQAGRKLKFDTEARLSDFAATVASNRIDAIGLAMRLRAELNDFHQVNLTTLEGHLAHQKQPALNFSASGQLDAKSQDADLQTSLEVFLPRVGELLGNPALQVATGRLQFTGRVAQKNQTPNQATNALMDRTLSGTAHFDDFTGHYGAYQFDRFGLGVECDLSLENQVAEIKKLVATLTQSDQPGGSIAFSGSYDLAKTNGQVTLRLEDLNQNILRAFAAPTLGSNRLESVAIGLTTTASFDPLAGSTVKGDFKLANLLVSDPNGQFPKKPITLAARFEAGLKDTLAALRSFSGELHQGELPGGALELSGSYDLKAKTGQANFQLTNLNQHALQPFLASALGDKTLASVSVNVTASANYDPKGDATAKGELQVLNLLLTDPKGQLPRAPLTTVVKLDGSLHDNLAEIRQCIGYVKQGDLLGGSFEVKGEYQVDKNTGRADFKLSELNQNALQPLLAAALGDKTLQSVSISANAEASYDAQGESSLKAGLQLANLLVADPAGQLPTVPLGLDLQLDASLLQKVATLRQLQIRLAETARARNQMQLAGRLDFSKTNTLAGNLKLTADSLDLTSYYDLFVGKKPTPTALTINAAPVPAGRPTEPAPITLPVDQFTFDSSIGRLFLRQIDISNLAATTRIEGGRILLDPCQLSLNGAPVTARADLNLGVPGYQYDLTLTANRVPVEPFAETFQLGQPGQFRGFTTANLTVKGAGVTGPSLQKNLSADAAFSLSEANLKLAGSGSSQHSFGGFLLDIFKPIALVLGLPDLTKSALTGVAASAKVAAGTMQLSQFSIEGPLFQATSAGTITLAEALDQSRLNSLPIDIALERNLAIKAGLAATDTPAGQPYVKLPNFVKVSGTVSQPEPQTDKLVITGLLLKSGASMVQDPNRLLPNAADLLKGAQPTLPTPQIPTVSTPTVPVPQAPQLPRFPLK